MFTLEIKRDEEPITCVSDLLREIKALSNDFSGSAIWMRGHSKYTDGLKPSIGREKYFTGVKLEFDNKLEENLLHRFRRYTHQHFNRILNEWEALFLARHHGLPVRLLDWTSSPLVALYFASAYDKFDTKCDEESTPNDGAIWAFVPNDYDSSFINVFTEPDPLKVSGVRMIYPFHVSERMTAQSCCFTIQDDPWRDLSDYARQPIPDQQVDLKKLVKWKVPEANRKEIIHELERCNINSRTLFPDLEGLAKSFWQTEALRLDSKSKG